MYTYKDMPSTETNDLIIFSRNSWIVLPILRIFLWIHQVILHRKVAFVYLSTGVTNKSIISTCYNIPDEKCQQICVIYSF